MRRFFLTASLLLVFLLTFLIPKVSAATSCKVSSILPERATSDDTIRITVTSLKPGLYYTLSVVNTLTPNNISPADINREVKAPNDSVEFSVSNLIPGNYTFTINGRKDRDINGQSVDYCFNQERGGFQVLTPSGGIPDIDQTGWSYDVNLLRCVQKIGGKYNSQQECESKRINPYCQIPDPSSLSKCNSRADTSDAKRCLTSDFKPGYVCGDTGQQIFCVKEGAFDPASLTAENAVACETPASPLPPCVQWGGLNGTPGAPGTQYVPIPTESVANYFNDQGKLSSGNAKTVTCLKVGTAIGDISTQPQDFVKSVFSVVLGLAGGIALLLIIISGYKFMTSGGNPEKTKAATEQLTSAVIGLLFIIFSFVILQIVGVDILRIPGFNP